MKSFLSAFAETFSPKQSIRFIVVLCLVGLFASYAFAQEATIVGTVTDPTGAAVPNAAITITNVETGIASNFTTNDVGQYAAPGLKIGRYSLRLTASGFKTVEQKDIVLSVGDRARLDFQLQVGGTSETVSVETSPIAVQTDSSEISDVITSRQVTQLATNGRSIYTLVNLTPGASSLQGDFQTPTPVGGDANVSFNGNRPGHNLYMMDGGENLDRGGAGTFSVMPSMDAIAEFRVLSSNYSAEYGLSSAGTMTTILKSGTNKYKASLWEFVRNDAFDANSFFFNRSDTKKAKLRYNTYGFNVGGPVDWWKDDHKTFFFYNMEWRKLIQGGNISGRTVPVSSTYGGNFTGAIPGNVTLADGTTVVPFSGLHVPCQNQLSAAQVARFNAAGITTFSTPGADGSCSVDTHAALSAQPTFVPFTGNAIPTALLDANAQALLAAGIFPAPTSGNQFNGGNDAPTNVREEIVRMDHNFSDKFSIFGHYVAEQIMQTFGTTMWSGDNVPSIGNTFGNPSYSGVVHTIHTISPTLINETSFNYNGNRIAILPKGLIAAPAGFTFNRVFTGPNEENRIPIINLGGSTGAQYSANWTPWRNIADSYQLRDDLSWTKGSHQMKFGGSWLFYKKAQDVFATTQGQFNFNNTYTGNDFADMLLGYATSYTENAVKDTGHWNSVSWAAYFQDNWRVNNKLTLNLGLRWDGIPHTYEANSRMSNFYPELYDPSKIAILSADGSTVDPSSPGLGTSPNPILAGYQFYVNGLGIDNVGQTRKGMVDPVWAAFGPRIGFAFDPTGSGKTVLRGGFGVMYERVQGNDVYGTGTNTPFSGAVTQNNVLLANPKTQVGGTGSTITVPPLPIVVGDITGFAAHMYKAPTSYQYSFSVQRSLAEKSVLSVSYVGNQGRHQSDYRQINLPAVADLAGIVAAQGAGYNNLVPYLGYKSIRLAFNEANSHYNSLQVELKSTVKRDLQLQFGYTWSKAEDPVAGNANGYDLNNVTNPYAGWTYDQGVSFFDRTHVAFVNFVYDLPIFRTSENAILKNGFGGWQLSGIVSMQSGAPLNVVLGSTNIQNYIPQTANRPDLVGAVHYTNTDLANGNRQWFDPTGAFATPAAGAWGNLPHNFLRGPGRDNWNLALFKSFTFNAERGTRLEFRAEAFNVWNHTQFRGDFQGGGVSTNTTASDFGHVTNTYLPRNLQFGLKLYF